MRLTQFALAAVAALAFQAGIAQAGIVTFSGSDDGASAPGAGSNGAAVSFDAAASLIGPASLLTFESQTATNSSANQTITLNGDVSVNGPAIDIRNTPTCAVAFCGDNTTSGGSQWLELFGQTATFSFNTPIQYFGAYFGGLQGTAVGQETITFNDGSSETVNIPELTGGFAFVGFTDAGASISSVTISALGDIISVDDVRYGPGSAAVPEPTGLALIGLGLIAVKCAIRRRRSS